MNAGSRANVVSSFTVVKGAMIDDEREIAGIASAKPMIPSESGSCVLLYTNQLTITACICKANVSSIFAMIKKRNS